MMKASEGCVTTTFRQTGSKFGSMTHLAYQAKATIENFAELQHFVFRDFKHK